MNNLVIIRVFFENVNEEYAVTKEDLLLQIEQAKERFELRDLSDNVILMHGTYAEKEELYAIEYALSFTDEIDTTKLTYEDIKEKDYEVVEITFIEEPDDLCYGANNNIYAVAETLEPNVFTFFRIDNDYLEYSEEENKQMTELLFEVLKAKYYTKYPDRTYEYQLFTEKVIGGKMIQVSVFVKEYKKPVTRVREKN